MVSMPAIPALRSLENFGFPASLHREPLSGELGTSRRGRLALYSPAPSPTASDRVHRDVPELGPSGCYAEESWGCRPSPQWRSPWADALVLRGESCGLWPELRRWGEAELRLASEGERDRHPRGGVTVTGDRRTMPLQEETLREVWASDRWEPPHHPI